MKIRIFEDRDSAPMISLFRRSVHEIACAFYTPEQLAVWAPEIIDQDHWTRRCQSRPTWLAFDGNILAGFVDLEAKNHVDMLFVSPDYQRQGVAQKLYNMAETQARQNGVQAMTVEASLSARPFFEKQGFSVLKQQEIERFGQTLINYAMRKAL